MSFYDELQERARQSLANGGIVRLYHIEPAVNYTLRQIQDQMLELARRGQFITSGDHRIVKCILPLDQSYIVVKRGDNQNLIIENNKLGFFRNRNLEYNTWITCELSEKRAEEYQAFKKRMTKVAEENGISVEFIIYDRSKKAEYPFPCQIEGGYFASNYCLALRCTCTFPA